MATPNFAVYDFDQVTVAVGPILIDGFQEGEGVEIEVPETFTMYVGGQGHVARSKTLNRTATITITLMQTSPVNDLLSALHILDRDAPNGAGVVPLFIRDRNGRALYTAAQCWISAAPAVSFGTEAGTRAWVLQCAKLERVDGGNG